MSERTLPDDASQPVSFTRWRIALLFVMVFGFTVLGIITVKVHHDAPPIPGKVVHQSGEVLFTGNDIKAGQEVFLRHALMDNGTIWGHGSYLGPDYSAQYLHYVSEAVQDYTAKVEFGKEQQYLSPPERTLVDASVVATLKVNRYTPSDDTLVFTPPEVNAFLQQIDDWTNYFARPENNGGLPANYIRDPAELRQLVAFFAWTSWASVASRPGEDYSYTNNFPYDPSVGNLPTGQTLLWSALSLVFLLGGIGAVLLAFGRFDYLGWGGENDDSHIFPGLIPGEITDSQRAILKYFAVVGLLFLVQVVMGGATAHYRADPASFYGIDISDVLPSNILRTWHLQLSIFWIATAYVAGALFLAPVLGEHEPKLQSFCIHLLFWALVVVVVGSMAGEWLGSLQFITDNWFWFGHQGWEYLELGRFWQILLAAGLLFWFFLVLRAVAPSFKDKSSKEMSYLFILSALAIPVFYLPAMFFDGQTHFSIVDTWRFWIIHLWVEGFFELFVTVLVAVILFRLGVVRKVTATRVIYLDAILYFGGGLIGTGHHWYFTGHTNMNMAFSAAFSALEVVPLTLITLDAWDFIKVTKNRAQATGQVISIPHKWTFMFLMAVGFWNFVGAGVFGFLINLPIVSYYEMGTQLTPNHGHAAMMGVFGMLALGLMVFCLRQISTDVIWKELEKYVRISFWGLNIGMFLMLFLSLFPGGVMQLLDVLDNGYWHARSLEYTGQEWPRLYEWLRLPGDVVFIVIGVCPIALAGCLGYLKLRKPA
ncbi:nitric-oxide reductase large subunit [Sansalvadorimonas verongulae]|uniref:nitric-oxide reductase large subunit n=1 Tax=Sansalvadorimonas verongulae TaxID=2172824 RepID=UPI0012BD5584|nr:nitric-oxide reductase large subunit [Sansalvadorimonas verongulae]MTI14485.1 nitric-oxide reductase large subunit [Sansalvadorimonas verongulae]